MKSISIIFIIVFSASICFAAEQQEGLFGMQWGETICQCVDRSICVGQLRRTKKGTEIIVKRRHFIKAIKFTPVKYIFDKRDCKLRAIVAYFKGDENFKYISDISYITKLILII